MAEEGLTYSPIKNAKLKKKLLKQETQKLREALPVLSTAEIRRYRLPYFEACVADLRDAGFANSAFFIEQLIQLQEDNRNRSGAMSTLWLQPRLMERRDILDSLCKPLGVAEAAHDCGDFAKEYDEMISLSAKFAFGPADWWWLGEQLLFQCILMDYPGSFDKQRATCAYLLGKYLFENATKTDSAIYYLDIARQLAEHKSWTCRKLLGPSQDIIFIECCNLLHDALHQEATSLMKTHPSTAAEIFVMARRRAAEACNHKSTFASMVEKGKCELAMGDSATAIATFIRALKYVMRQNDTESICEARVQLALAYLRHSKFKEALECLEKLKAIATEQNLPYYLGQAYRHMGEHYLKHKQYKISTPLLLCAFFIFHRNNYIEDREEVRTLSAISAGEEVLPYYVDLILKCDNTEQGHRHLMTLLRWKDDRLPFWPTALSRFKFPRDDEDIANLEKMASSFVSLQVDEELASLQCEANLMKAQEAADSNSETVRIYFQNTGDQGSEISEGGGEEEENEEGRECFCEDDDMCSQSSNKEN